ncbi:MAG: hypothetical protein OSJ34_07980, partial [Muribaculaceae bacterium]|nr:hypothetical protein [Muribaculaceae bacterium]
MNTLYLPGEPGVFGLDRLCNLAHIQAFPPAPKPCIRVNTPLMRSDDQHLTIKANGFPLCSLVPGVEVGTISANELRNIVDHLGSLGSEELVYICIGLNIYRVSDDVTHSHPTEVVARLVLYPVSAQVFDNVGEGCLRLRVQSIDELDNLYLLWDGAIHTGLDSVHNDVLKLISIRH